MTDNDRTAQLERACSYLRRIPAWYLATTDVADGRSASREAVFVCHGR